MTAEIGHYALVLALALAIVQSIVPIWGAARNDARLMAVGDSTAIAGLAFTGLAFAALVYGYVQSDFSIVNVYQNSHSAKPLLYKVTGTWGNHEGSMVLWILILWAFAGLVALFGGNLPNTLRARVLAVQAWIAAAFLIFVLATSNPFLRLDPAPIEGRDLNPILQDIGLAIHPPLLYMGYVGFSIAFSFAVAALIEGKIDAAWARWVRPWSLAAWIFLTLGISMGSYWAYYELGWGGWWFWDPVENASFMPWLAGTALLHSAVVMEKREALKVWTILLAILTFSLSLLGTFLVRSGVLTSVHTFATDPTRGVFILAILCVFIGGALALYAWRAPMLRQGGLFAPVSREGALVLNNLFLTAGCAAVFVGTLYPLALESLTGERISVGPPFFNLTFGPLMIPLLLAVPFGPMLAWKRGDLLGALQRLWAAAALAVIAVPIFYAFTWGSGAWLAPLGVGLALWLMIGSMAELWERLRIGREPLATSWRRAVGLPRATWGTAVAHCGVGVMVLGIVFSTAFEEEKIVAMQPGDSIELAGRTLAFEALVPRQGPNFREDVGIFSLREGGNQIARIEPSKRLYPSQNMPTTEAGIHTFWTSQVYLTLGDQLDGGNIAVRAYNKPLVVLIWFGTVVMSIGGILSLSDRRLRIGAPRPARQRARPAPAE